MGAAKENVVVSAAKLFARGGFRTANMREVADNLGVSRSSLYYHFPEKSDLLNEILTYVIDKFCERAREIVDYPLSAAQRLSVLIQAVIRLELETPGVSLALIIRTEGETLRPEHMRAYIAKRDEYEGYFRRLIDEGIATGEFRAVNTKITTFALLGMLEEFDAWFDPEGPLNADQVAEVFSDLLLTALNVTAAPGPHRGPRPELSTRSATAVLPGESGR
jgi:TetR/AcrR family transcriptional regulator, cholesterol catabolism regulator